MSVKLNKFYKKNKTSILFISILVLSLYAFSGQLLSYLNPVAKDCDLITHYHYHFIYNNTIEYENVEANYSRIAVDIQLNETFAIYNITDEVLELEDDVITFEMFKIITVNVSAEDIGIDPTLVSLITYKCIETQNLTYGDIKSVSFDSAENSSEIIRTSFFYGLEFSFNNTHFETSSGTFKLLGEENTFSIDSCKFDVDSLDDLNSAGGIMYITLNSIQYEIHFYGDDYYY